jgi:hypothetical protein
VSGAVEVSQQVATWLGGTYDTPTRSYRTPTVAGIGIVQRGWPKYENFADYTAGMAAGTQTGCQVVVWLPDIDDNRRVALPAVQGRRKVLYDVELHCYFWSVSASSEDCTDAVYALRDAIVAKIHTDPTLGTGGIEAGHIQVGEGDNPRIGSHQEQGNTVDGATKAYMLITFQATAYDVG